MRSLTGDTYLAAYIYIITSVRNEGVTAAASAADKVAEDEGDHSIFHSVGFSEDFVKSARAYSL